MNSSRTESLERPKLRGLLGFIETVGNKIPSPYVLFVSLFAIIALVSAIVAAFDVKVVVPGAEGEQTIVSALAPASLVEIISGAVKNFTEFPALGPVLTVVLGVAVAQHSGALQAGMRLVISRFPKSSIAYIVAFVSCQGHVMSDASFLIIPPLAALAFRAAGRNPLTGLLGSYACIGTGYAGGLLPGTLDASLAGITQQSARLIPTAESFESNIMMNYYFGVAAGLILPIVGGLIIDKVLDKSLHNPTGTSDQSEEAAIHVTTQQRRGVIVATVCVVVFFAVMILLWLIPGSPLRGENDELAPSPFLSSLVVFIAIGFFIFGVVYSRVALPKQDRTSFGKLMEKGVSEMASFIVLIFLVAQTVALLDYTNLATWVAVSLADAARSMGIQGFIALVILVLISSLLNILIVSGSGLWSLESTVMVPALTMLKLNPAIIQAAHRIGDSITQAVTPMNVMLYVVLKQAQQYDPKMNIGSFISRLIPFVPAFGLVWVGILAGFYFFDIPPGPGYGITWP